MRRTLLFGLLLAALTTACVSKKTYLSAVANYDLQLDSLQREIATRTGRVNALTLELAQARGGNEALVATQDRLQIRIDALQAEIDQLNRRATNTQEDLGGQLQAKDREIAARQARIDGIRQFIDRRDSLLNRVAQVLRDSLTAFPTNRVSLEVKGGQAILTLNEGLLFASGSATRLETAGRSALKKISEVLQAYPALSVQVVGHTDNQPRRSGDNWDFSVQRGATVAKALVEDYDLGSNRVAAGGRGPFAPLTSNETPEGRAQNRRIEILIAPRETDLLRDIERFLQ